MPKRAPQLFAVIPAAGLSKRMGEPKLLLPLGNASLILRLLNVLAAVEVNATVVVARFSDDALAAEVRKSSALLVQPQVNPPDMRASVSQALCQIEEQFAPQPDDGWLLIPADHPVLDEELLTELITAWNSSTADILLPTYQQRRGHPTFFRWQLSREIDALPDNCGLNRLVANHAENLQEVAVDNPAVLIDIDTPADYTALCNSWKPN